MPRPTHPNKEIESALRYAQSRGWKVIEGGGHCWGKLYCPWNSANCRCGEVCIVSIWSTPKKPGNFARQIKRVVNNCVIEKAVSGDMDLDTEHLHEL